MVWCSVDGVVQSGAVWMVWCSVGWCGAMWMVWCSECTSFMFVAVVAQLQGMPQLTNVC